MVVGETLDGLLRKKCKEGLGQDFGWFVVMKVEGEV